MHIYGFYLHEGLSCTAVPGMRREGWMEKQERGMRDGVRPNEVWNRNRCRPKSVPLASRWLGQDGETEYPDVRASRVSAKGQDQATRGIAEPTANVSPPRLGVVAPMVCWRLDEIIRHGRPNATHAGLVRELYVGERRPQVRMIRIPGWWRYRGRAVSVRMARLTGRARSAISGKAIKRIHLHLHP
jgi:hypothetical protein